MNLINLAWATPIRPDCQDELREFYKAMRANWHEALLAEMQSAGQAAYYGAWLQTQPIGPVLIEFWSSRCNYKEIARYYQNCHTPFRQWYLKRKSAVAVKDPAKLIGVRKVIDRDLSDFIPTGNWYGNVLPVSDGKLAAILQFLDKMDRADVGQRNEYFEQMGLSHWQAWLLEYDDFHLILQCNNMTVNFPEFRKRFEKNKSAYARFIADGFARYFNLRLTESASWQEVECLLSVER